MNEQFTIECRCGEIITYPCESLRVECPKCGDVWLARPALYSVSHGCAAKIIQEQAATETD